MPQSFTDLLDGINAWIINPFILLLFAVALVMFVWGIVEFIGGGAQEGERREKGKKNLLYGVVGLFIMIAVYGIIRIIGGTLGLDIANLYIFS